MKQIRVYMRKVEYYVSAKYDADLYLWRGKMSSRTGEWS